MMKKRVIGFSLVELVVVILLIGILSAVAVPRLFQSTYKAYDAAIQRFNAELASALNILTADWLLNGKPVIYEGFIFDAATSKYGAPRDFLGIGTDGTQVADGLTLSEDKCVRLAVELLGFPVTMFQTTTVPPVFTAVDQIEIIQAARDAGADWLVEDAAGEPAKPAEVDSTGKEIAPATTATEGGCNYWYIKGYDEQMNYAGVRYTPGARASVQLIAK